MCAQTLRDLLEQLSVGAITLGELCSAAPNCACEGATVPAGCVGPVIDDEVLRFFLCSPSEQKWPSEQVALMNKVKSRSVKPSSFRRAFKSGLSVIRIDHASPEEINLAAAIQFDNMKHQDPYSGGIYAVFEFRAIDARQAFGGEGMCVYATPLDRLGSDSYARPNHSDVATRRLPVDEVDRSRLERELYDHLMNTGRARCVALEDVDSGTLRKFLPAAVLAVIATPPNPLTNP